MATKAQIIDFLLAGYRDPLTDTPLVGGTIDVTLSGTSTTAYVWTDGNKTLPTTTGQSTITLDAYGKAEVYGDNIYKFVIKDSTGATVETIDYYESRSVISNQQILLADLLLISGTSGQIVQTAGRTSIGDGGEGKWVGVVGSIPITDTLMGVYVPFANGLGYWKRMGIEPASIFWYGFEIGSGATPATNTAAFQAALDANIVVRVPIVDDVLLVTSGINIATGKRIIFDSEFMGQPLAADAPKGLIGDGSGTIFTTNTYPITDNGNREIRIDNAKITNTGYPCIELLGSDDAHLNKCSCWTTDSEALKIRFSARVNINGGDYSSSFAVLDANANFTITAYDNCNGLYVHPSTIISGGTNGGGIDVSQSQKICVDGIYESCGGYGIRVSGWDGVGAGNCNGVKISGYLEEVQKPISIGLTNLALGVTFGEIYVGNTNQAAPDYCVELGRVSGLSLNGGVSFHKKGTEPTFLFIKTAFGSIVDFLWDSEILNYYSQNGGPQYSLSGFTEPGELFGGNRILLTDGEGAVGLITGQRKTYISHVIDASVGLAATAIELGSVYGGVIDKIEVVDATGTLGSTISIGYVSDVSYNATVDPSTLTLSSQASEVSITNRTILSSTDLRLYVANGAGTGTFRVRVTYRT